MVAMKETAITLIINKQTFTHLYFGDRNVKSSSGYFDSTFVAVMVVL